MENRNASAQITKTTTRRDSQQSSTRYSDVGRTLRPRGGAGVTPMANAGCSTRARSTALMTPGLCTPGLGAVPFTPRIHETPRVARVGEMALSANGSPINIIHTVRAKGKRGQASVSIALADGSEMDLSDEATQADLAYNNEARAEAVAQLLDLKAQLDAHLKALREGCPMDHD